MCWSSIPYHVSRSDKIHHPTPLFYRWRKLFLGICIYSALLFTSHFISSHLFFTTYHLQNYLHICNWESQDLKSTCLRILTTLKIMIPSATDSSDLYSWWQVKVLHKERQMWLVLRGQFLHGLLVMEAEWNCQVEQGQDNGTC